MNNSKDIYLILLDIRSAENVGALFRTADASGVSKIFLIGTTPAPVDRFGRARNDIAKSALGAEKTIFFEYRKSVGPLLKKLKKDKVQIIAIEQSTDSVDYKKVKAKCPVAFIVGNEVSGIPDAVLKKCDVVAEIPMLGKKESLNVSVSAGIALFRILNI
jgi:23S rRNA (guanosine2251-2'-O)-methyltransferase